MPTQQPLQPYLVLQRALDRQVLASLRSASAAVDAELARLTRQTGIGAQVRAAQITAAQARINTALAQHWTRVGNLVAAAQATAAAEAAERTFANSDALRRAVGAENLALMTRSVREAAAQAVRVSMERVGGSSYIPLASSVYRNADLASGKIGSVIDAALARGASAAELARDVRAYVNPNTPGGVTFASNRLARTELNNAFHASQVRTAQEAPWVIGVKWNLSGSHPKPDECNRYAESVHIPGGDQGVYEKSNVPAKPHPQCLCFTTTVDEDDDEFFAGLESGRYDAYLDAHGVPPAEVSGGNFAKVGSKALTEQMAAAERQRRSLESAKYVTKGRNKGQYNAERGYTGTTNRALQGYTEMLNVEMNALLRNPEAFLKAQGAGEVEFISEKNAALESLFKHNPLDEDVTVARFMTGDFSGLKSGEFFGDPGFLSTTTDLTSFVRESSGAYARGLASGQQAWKFIIKAPKGTGALPGADYQREIIFGPGTKQRILSVDRQTNTVYTEIVR